MLPGRPWHSPLEQRGLWWLQARLLRSPRLVYLQRCASGLSWAARRSTPTAAGPCLAPGSWWLWCSLPTGSGSTSSPRWCPLTKGRAFWHALPARPEEVSELDESWCGRWGGLLRWLPLYWVCCSRIPRWGIWWLASFHLVVCLKWSRRFFLDGLLLEVREIFSCLWISWSC